MTIFGNEGRPSIVNPSEDRRFEVWNEQIGRRYAKYIRDYGQHHDSEGVPIIPTGVVVIDRLPTTEHDMEDAVTVVEQA